MKRTALLLIVFSAMTLLASAQMDNLTNLSAKWIRSSVRNASLDGSADMVNYNPAGLAMLDDGIYLSVSNQTLFRKPMHSFNFGQENISAEQEGIDPFLPMLYAAWKKNKISISTGVYVSGGGATVNYPKGSINTYLMGFMLLPYMAETAGYTSFNEQSLEASSYYLTFPLIFSYPISDKLAVSIGGRYLMGMNKVKAGITYTGSELYPDNPLTIDYRSTANGIGSVIGIDYKPTDKLNLAIHYETKVKLEFEAKDNKGTFQLEEDGVKSRRDLPAVLNTGATYSITEKLTGGIDFNYYFQTDADWGEIQDPNTGEFVKAAEAAGDAYAANLGFTYQMDEKLELSAGCSYTAFMIDDIELYYTLMGNYEALKYSNLNVGIGGGYYLTKNIQLDLGISRTFWKDREINSPFLETPVNVADKAYVIAIGLDFRF